MALSRYILKVELTEFVDGLKRKQLRIISKILAKTIRLGFLFTEIEKTGGVEV